MLDINYIRENPDRVKEFSRQKGYAVDVDNVLRLDERRRSLTAAIDKLREQRNDLARQMKSSSKPSADTVTTGKRIKSELAKLEEELSYIDTDYTFLLKQIPNTPTDDTPVGETEDENIVTEEIGDLPEFAFDPKNHWEIAAARGWIDKERAAKVAGSRFAYLMGDLVKLQMAVMQFTINALTDEETIKSIIKSAKLTNISTKPFTPVLPPFMIKTDPYDAMDRLQPSEDRYKIEGDELWLQGSAEHVLGSMHADEIFAEADMPIRYLGYATSFRKEAGTYGKDMEGILRMHQFDKLEMESFTTAESSLGEHLFFVAIQRYLLEQLELPYRVLMKCTADIGKPNARGIDMEVWLPGQGKYRETHTADYMTDYQARRLKTRVRRASGAVELIHTNDATAFALGRILIAIIENNQTADMRVNIPAVLQPYLGGKTQI
ncbi:serine--tRNA ligase [Candidatus Saccharibacteria bacterium]|nr:serine--tRNA ligase [Candidatus Saccharibacteria bacterium]